MSNPLTERNKENNIRNIKVVVVGESSVGKSALLQRYIDGTFSTTESNIDNGFKVKHVCDLDGNPAKLVIWDTAGQERFRSITASFFHGVSGVLLAFSITDKSSFDKLNLWLDAVKAYSSSSTPIILVGNKVDLSDKNRQVEKKTAEEFAETHKLQYLETSALNGEGVAKAFDSLTQIIFQKLSSRSPKKKTSSSSSSSSNSKSKCEII